MKYPLVEVFWVDSASPADGWVNPNDVGLCGVAHIKTSGFQVRKTTTEITIAQSIHDQDKQPDVSMAWGHLITIPRVAVTKVRRLT